MSLLKILNKFLSSGENMSHVMKSLLPLSPLSPKNEILVSQTPHRPTPCASHTVQLNTALQSGAQAVNIIQNFVEMW